MRKEKNVILSTTLVIGEGEFSVKKINIDQARQWAADNNFQNFCGHQTTRILGVEPAKTRKACEGYTQALCLSPKARLERREYSLSEISEIGVEFTLISKLSKAEEISFAYDKIGENSEGKKLLSPLDFLEGTNYTFADTYDNKSIDPTREVQFSDGSVAIIRNPRQICFVGAIDSLPYDVE